MAARILVADDSVTIQKVVELTFSKEDFVLVQARSGEEAIRKAKEERPDLVLLDLVMPDKNGYEVCAALRAEPMLRAVPIILLTGTFEAFDKAKGTQAGANDFVTKPFESQVLISKVKQLLFAKTVDMAPAAAPVGPAKTAPPKEAPRPAPTMAAPPPAGMPPRPSPAPGLSRGVTPGAMRGIVPPSPASTTPLRTATAPAGPPATPAPSAAASATPRMAAVPAERPIPPPVPPRVERTLDLSPPSEEISQDRVRSVVEPPSKLPPAAAPGGFGGLSLEELTTLPLPEIPGRPGNLHLALEKAASGPAEVPEELSLEMPSLAPEIDQKEQAPPPPEVGAPALPESLSLEDLLTEGVTGAPLAAEPAPMPLEEFSGGPVFDLTAEMGGPALPLVEVGTGEAPALSIEDLLASAGVPPPPPAEVAGLELPAPGPEAPAEELPGGPVFDLTSAQELTPPPVLDAGAEEPPALSVEDLLLPQESTPVETGMMGLHDLEMELISGPPAAGEPVTPPTPITAPPLDLGPLIEAPLTTDEVDFEAVLAEGKEPVPPPVVPPAVVPPPMALPSVPAMEAGIVLAEEAAAAVSLPEMDTARPIAPKMPGTEAVPPAAAAVVAPGGAKAVVPEMAAMRQEVTERVANELARDLSDKLLERIERIVWEVVPDLAEILISKEIERIRLQAEGKQSS